MNPQDYEADEAKAKKVAAAEAAAALVGGAQGLHCLGVRGAVAAHPRRSHAPGLDGSASFILAYRAGRSCPTAGVCRLLDFRMPTASSAGNAATATSASPAAFETPLPLIVVLQGVAGAAGAEAAVVSVQLCHPSHLRL